MASPSVTGANPGANTASGFPQVTALMTAPSASTIAGLYTFLTLPTVGLLPGVTAYTTDQGAQIWNGIGWVSATPSLPQTSLAARRIANITAFLSGAAVPAPAWVVSTAYVVGNCVTLPGGQVITCTTAGTSAASAPVYSKTQLNGRPLTDNTVTWYGVYQVNSAASSVAAPTVSLNASAAAAGLTETRLSQSSSLSPLLTCFGGVLTRYGYQNGAAAFTFASGPAIGAGNTTALATSNGYSNAYVYNAYNYDIEFYVTDAVVGLTLVSSTALMSVEIDGVLMQCAPQILNGTAGQALVFDFNGVVKRRKVVVACSPSVGASVLRGVALSTIGYVEVTDSPNDVMLLLGDSILQTISNPAPQQPIAYVGALLKRYLGLAGVIGAGQGGSGYVAQVANTLNALNILLNPVNQQIFTQTYQPTHVLICEGYNDVGTWTPATVAAAALQCWTAARTLFPTAKITITDGFSQATGPSAAALSQAAAILAQFTVWGDQNSRFISMTGPSATVAWLQGTGTASGGIVAGNTCNYVGTDNVHPTPMGADYLAKRLAAAINTAWNGAY